MMPFSLIAAMDAEHGIGKAGGLPWHLPGDLKHFKTLTTQTASAAQQNAVLMGRKTWASIPEKFRPLPNRINLVLTRDKQLKLPAGVLAADSLATAFDQLEEVFKDRLHHVYVIGGQQVFEAALPSPYCQKLYLSHIQQAFQCDTFFPAFKAAFERTQKTASFEENGTRYFFAEYRRKTPKKTAKALSC